jgi:hypothetical protein
VPALDSECAFWKRQPQSAAHALFSERNRISNAIALVFEDKRGPQFATQSCNGIFNLSEK